MFNEGGISSVYFWDNEHGFGGFILIKKAGDGSNKKIKGFCDSITLLRSLNVILKIIRNLI
jgi:hypothetical protein